jgi:hypothetical protein
MTQVSSALEGSNSTDLSSTLEKVSIIQMLQNQVQAEQAWSRQLEDDYRSLREKYDSKVAEVHEKAAGCSWRGHIHLKRAMELPAEEKKRGQFIFYPPSPACNEPLWKISLYRGWDPSINPLDPTIQGADVATPIQSQSAQNFVSNPDRVMRSSPVTGRLKRRPGYLGLLGGASEGERPRTEDSADGSEAELADSL